MQSTHKRIPYFWAQKACGSGLGAPPTSLNPALGAGGRAGDGAARAPEASGHRSPETRLPVGLFKVQSPLGRRAPGHGKEPRGCCFCCNAPWRGTPPHRLPQLLLASAGQSLPMPPESTETHMAGAAWRPQRGQHTQRGLRPPPLGPHPCLSPACSSHPFIVYMLTAPSPTTLHSQRKTKCILLVCSI